MTKRLEVAVIERPVPRRFVSITVLLQPQNENQDLNYMEHFTGTPFEIVQKSRRMILELSIALRLGSFSVKVENLNCSDEVYIFDTYILDRDGNRITEIY